MLRKKQVISNGGGLSHNTIASGTVIKGNVIATEDFRIDGVVEGNIECKGKVIVGPKGEIFGHINCENAELFGTVHGNIKTTETLYLKGGSSYSGELNVKYLEIETGAAFNGTCKMMNEQPTGSKNDVKKAEEASSVSAKK